MIVVQITAGLGNQLFQYSCARAMSLRLGVPLRFDLTYYTRKPNRPYRLGAYGLPAQAATERELALYFTPFHRFPYVRGMALRLNRYLPFDRRRIIQEASPRFDARLLEIQRPVYLSGFWQCDRYFGDQADAIRGELTLRTPIPECYQGVRREIESSESVGLVVRRGDYLGIPNTQGICTLEYYRRALAIITATVPQRRVFVFSDDIPWCQENLALEEKTVFVPNESPERPEEHLRILSGCRYFILANSSYAWWGAWLSTHRGKIVIGPSKWMQDADQLGDLLPQQWMQIPNKQ
jgi:hypothetical protein